MHTVTLQLAAGQLVLGPLLAATLSQHKERLAAANRGEITDPFELIDLVCTVAHAAAQRVAPAISREAIESLIDLENLHQVYAAVWGTTLPGETPPAASPAT